MSIFSMGLTNDVLRVRGSASFLTHGWSQACAWEALKRTLFGRLRGKHMCRS